VQFPAVLCSFIPASKQGTERKQTFRYPKISIISWTAWCPTLSCAAISLAIILRSCPMSSSTFCLLRSFAAGLDRPQSRDSSVGIALGYGLDDRGSRVRFPVEAGTFSLHHRVQNGSGVHQASYPMGTRGSFPGGKAAEA
jgi:hypothetical protein